MDTVFWLLALQGVLGAFDIVYHHEITERLTWRRSAAFELKLHGARNVLYGLLYVGLGWCRWHGLWAWLLGLILVVEVALTLWDFVIEDRTRLLPASERVTHTLLALNYGVILALLFPHLRRATLNPSQARTAANPRIRTLSVGARYRRHGFGRQPTLRGAHRGGKPGNGSDPGPAPGDGAGHPRNGRGRPR